MEENTEPSIKKETTSIKEVVPVKKEKKIRSSMRHFLGVIIISFSFGILGGVLSIYVYSNYLGDDSIVNTIGSKNITVEENSAVIDAVKKASPSVVSITSEQSGYGFFGQAFRSQSAGTGFIVGEDGLIITNKHVVSDSNAKYSVFTSDGKEYDAEIQSTDPLTDIAFLKVDASGLLVAELGDSDKLEIGQKVVAIGNALGQYQNTVTSGVISAVGRAIQAGDGSSSSYETLNNVIQTDAAINPGNSGGPLINLDGQVIGINTAIDQEGQLIGFAIPINMAKSAVKSVLETGKVSRPMIGVRYIPITKEFAARNDLPVDEGVLVYGEQGELAVVPGSPAAKAGVKEGDIITKIDDDKIDESHSLKGLLMKHNVGDKITLTILRNEKEEKVNVTLTEAK